MAVYDVKFDTVEEFRDYLVRLSYEHPVEVDSLVEHERAHFEKALELGYNPRYGVLINPDSLPRLLLTFVYMEEHVPEGDDLIDICMAPKSPSLSDFQKASREKTRMLDN